MRSAAFQRRRSADTIRRLPAMERHAILVHGLGARVLLELLLDVGCENDCVAAVDARLASYARLPPEAVRLAGGDRMVPRRLMLVPG